MDLVPTEKARRCVLYSPDGSVMRSWTHLRDVPVRIMRLDADGQPVGPAVETTVKTLNYSEGP